MEYVSTFKNRLIYIFRINDPAHQGCVKIGEATAPDGFFAANSKELNEAARARINSYTQTAGIRYELLHTEMTLYTKGGQVKSFNDKQVHDILLRSGIQRKSFDIEGNAQEWFCCDLSTAKNAIEAARNGQSCLHANQKSQGKSPVTFRPEQEEAIKKTLKVLKKGNKILWNAKMRMGKTLSSLEVVKEMKCHRTIIITHRPVVDDGWFDDFGKIFYEEDTPWLYGSKNKGESDFGRLERSGKNYVYFASMQDLRGSKIVGGKFDKNKEVFHTPWDMLIIDEAHEGTQTEKGLSVQEMLTKPETKVINLSGTPFNLLERGDFDDSNTFTWDYVMEQRAKQEWALKHPGDYNPYEELPKLNLLTFNLGDLALDFQDEDKAFNFTEFFRTDDDGQFVHRREVAHFLDIISSDKGETLYPFSSAQYREFFHHTFWIVPGVAAGLALAEMLRSHPVFGTYSIVNVCGNEDEDATADPLDDVRRAIGPKPEDSYTITLSCGKLTTGVTVREWTAVLYLAGSKSTSPASYMQTIFRVQSPGKVGGRMKTDCYVFDFAPDRTLKMVAEAAKVSAKAGDTDQEDRQILGEFLNFCPIIACDGTVMSPYNVDQMMQQLKRVYVDKVVNTGFEDGHLYSNKLMRLSDGELESFANLREIIGQTKASQHTREIKINEQGFDNEDIEKVKREAKKKGKNLTPEQLEELAKLQRRRKQRDLAVSILRGISIRMPLLLYGAKLTSEDEKITLDRFVELVDDTSWAEFMPMGVTKDRFADYKQYYDEDIFAAAGHQIRQLALAADSLSVLQRIQRIAEIFSAFRNPDKETVLTPWRVVNMHLSDTVGGYCFYDDGFETIAPEPHFKDCGIVSQRLFENANVRILEINSKSGLYPLYMAYSVFRHRLRVAEEGKRSLFKTASIEEERNVWRNVLRENIFVICKTEMARAITQRTLCGFDPTMKVNTHVYDDLLNQITNKQQEFIRRLLSGSIFPQIKNNMKFDAIVGNPPYQVMDGGAGVSAIPVYHHFVDVAQKVAPQYISMIMPAKWYNGGRGLEPFRKKMLNDKHLKCLYDFIDGHDCFPNVDIAGGVCYFLWDNGYDGLCNFVSCFNGNRKLSERDLSLSEVLIRHQEEVTIISKITSSTSDFLDKLVYSQKPFGLRTYVKPLEKGNISLRYNGGIGKYDRELVPINKELIDKWKIIMSCLTAEHAGESDKNGQKRIFSSMEILEPKTICTETYMLLNVFDNEIDCQSMFKYLKSQFVRSLVAAITSTQHMSKANFQFVPLQDFTSHSDIDWTQSVSDIDRQLYKKYNLSDEEIAFIEQMIKPME